MPSALITGANRGLGLELARQYLADGWRIYAACRDPASASELHDLPSKPTTNCGYSLWMSLTRTASTQEQLNSTDKPLTSCSTTPALSARGARPVGNIDYQALGGGARRQHHGSYAGVRSFCRACGPERSQADRDSYQRHGVHCRQNLWRLHRLSQLQGRSEHGHAQSGD